jgi:hypothetical protein
MKNIFIIAEGPSEERFAKKILGPHFLDFDKNIIPITALTKKDNRHGTIHKGGITTYRKFQNTLHPILKQAAKSGDAYVTTMVDFYALPTDTPGHDESMKCSSAYDKVKVIETAISEQEGYKQIFLPYIQLHEFEALLFTDVEQLLTEYFDYNIDELRQALVAQPNPELINNSFDTAPSKRILKAISIYDKTVAGVEVLCKIGLDQIRQKCKHFNDWITHLEQF